MGKNVSAADGAVKRLFDLVSRSVASHLRCMHWFFESPQSEFLAALCLPCAVWAYWRGVRSFWTGFRNPDHPDQSLLVVKGFRGAIVATALLFIGGGLYWSATWAVLFGLVFVGEELFETGIMMFALKRGARQRSRNGASSPEHMTATGDSE
ncbi:MAG TPA: hypothetical protein VLB27_05635 [candidate division Zixibacteria bacterium]|nr:hypothetical protein [candidate division Zixibacteria bacterium]